MERRYYSVDTLREELDEFEREFGISSEVFCAAREANVLHRMGRATPDPFDATVWASTYRQWRELRVR